MTSIAELRRLEAEATQGPWTSTDNSWEVSSIYGPDDCLIAEAQIHPSVTEENQHNLEPVKEANAALIVAMRNALPELLRKAEAFDQIVAQGGEAHGGNVAISQSFAKRQSRPISGAFDRKHPLPPHGGVDVG